VIDAVFDTNVLAAGFAGSTQSSSIPGELLRRWRAKAFVLIVSEPILKELAKVFGNHYFSQRLSITDIDEAFARLHIDGRIQPVTIRVAGIAAHAEDDLILATALSAQAQYLVTGDKQLLKQRAYRGTLLVSPRQFLEILDKAATA
jgi:putative PIN family toxin of toxin-antitoxin system